MRKEEKIEENIYDDIINLPHHESSRHARMSRLDRAAQFAPFAALTGHNEAVKETARLTEEKIELDENAKAFLDRQLQMIIERLEDNPKITITYFVFDEKKEGGRYESYSGYVKKVDEFAHRIIMTEGKRIPIEDIVKIEGDIFLAMELL